jgi:hypothetical protein
MAASKPQRESNSTMALGIQISSGNGSGEDFTPIVKYDARAGRAFRVDRTQGANGWETNPVDITRSFKAVMDFENLEVGFIDFPAGAAPVFAMVLHGKPMPGKPSDKAKQGVRITMMLAKECGGERPLREMAGNSAAFLRGVDALHDAYEHGKGANPGKLPVVVLKDTIGIKSGSGDKQSTNYQPIFEITGWVPRPEKLIWKPKNGAAPATTSAASPIAREAPPSTGSTRAEPPQPAAAQQPEMADVDDFG